MFGGHMVSPLYQQPIKQKFGGMNEYIRARAAATAVRNGVSRIIYCMHVPRILIHP
jgi:hypothetical protein